MVGDAIPAASPETSVAPRISGRRRKNGGYFGWMSYTNFLSAMDIKDQTYTRSHNVETWLLNNTLRVFKGLAIIKSRRREFIPRSISSRH